MCGAPSNVPDECFRDLIAPVSYVQWLLRAVGGLSIPHRASVVKLQGSQRPCNLDSPPNHPFSGPRQGR